MNERFSEIITLLNTKEKQRLNKYSTKEIEKKLPNENVAPFVHYTFGHVRIEIEGNAFVPLVILAIEGKIRKTQYYNVMFLNGM